MTFPTVAEVRASRKIAYEHQQERLKKFDVWLRSAILNKIHDSEMFPSLDDPSPSFHQDMTGTDILESIGLEYENSEFHTLLLKELADAGWKMKFSGDSGISIDLGVIK